MRKLISSLVGALALVTGVLTASGALAATTLNFDTDTNGTAISDGTPITTQYSNVGVTVSGATVVNAELILLPANTPPNLVYAPTGLMTFALDSSITGNVQQVSAYLTGSANVGIFAYDASNNLVGQTITSASTNNTLVSLTSFAPIATVQIHNGGSAFYVDTLTFSSPTQNLIPIANAGPNRGGEVGDLIVLNGRKSYDPDKPPQPLTYRWTQLSGPATVTLNGATTVNPNFTPSVPGLYVFSLVVNDGISNSLPSTVQINIRPAQDGCRGCSPF